MPAAIRAVLAVLLITCAIVGVVLYSGAPGSVQSALALQHPDENDHVRLDKVEVSFKREKGNTGTPRGVVYIRLRGKTPRLPIGTRVELHVKSTRREPLERFMITVNNSRKFNKEFAAPNIDGYIKSLYIRSHIAYDAQTEVVMAAMKKRPEQYYIDTSPWGEAFMDKRFDIGTDSDREKQNDIAREYFKSRMIQLIELDRKVGEVKQQVLAKKAFHRGDRFDADGWQKWLNGKIRDPLRKIQGEIGARKHTIGYLRHQRDLTVYFSQLTRGVAKRSVDRSKELYRALDLELDKRDIYVEGLQTNLKRKASSKFLQQRIVGLAESQGIPLSELGLGSG